MKKHIKLYLSLVLILIINTSYNSADSCLCGNGEENIITFKILKSTKSVSVCEGKNSKYLVYRFGKKDKIELEYPNKKDESSWDEFYFDSYYRGGGYQNAARSSCTLSFENKDVYYIINHSNYVIDSTENGVLTKVGIEVITDNKTIELKGDPSTLLGTLGGINEAKIKNRGHILDK